ncbi:hypothetical protein Rcae01_02847 [Novipirellula caenicola]|uniref:Uncharacterized protein n=1 Tax=Novipirellula caenicola TaxID=1536901 RepID=A0ABP9VQG2_9BACT
MNCRANGPAVYSCHQARPLRRVHPESQRQSVTIKSIVVEDWFGHWCPDSSRSTSTGWRLSTSTRSLRARPVAVTWDGRLNSHLKNRASRPRMHGSVLASCFLRTCTRTQHRGTRTRLRHCTRARTRPRYPIVQSSGSTSKQSVWAFASIHHVACHQARSLRRTHHESQRQSVTIKSFVVEDWFGY